MRQSTQEFHAPGSSPITTRSKENTLPPNLEVKLREAMLPHASGEFKFLQEKFVEEFF